MFKFLAKHRILSLTAVIVLGIAGLAIYKLEGTKGSKQAKYALTEAPFTVRGVIEGFYGQPWTDSQREDMLKFMSVNKFNTYVYAPKNDSYARENWAKPYPPDRLKALQQLAQSAAKQGINFVYTLSPGIPVALPGESVTPSVVKDSITYSSNEDRQKILAKIAQLRQIGIHSIMLAFDDNMQALKTQDFQVYQGNYASAQIDLTNYVLQSEQRQDKDFQVWFVPVDYSGVDDSSYWLAVRQNLNLQIKVLWTGPAVLSKHITDQEAEKVTQLLGRKPLIWDNYPVNDYTYAVNKKPQLFMGPLENRSPDLQKFAEGLLANPMIQPEASKVALYTVGKYLYNPASYNSGEAWQQGINNIAGVGDKSAFAEFCRYSSESFLDKQTNSSFNKLAQSFWQSYPTNHSTESKDALLTEMRTVAGLKKELQGTTTNKNLLQEIDPWLGKLSDEGDAGIRAIQYLTNGRSSSDRARLEAKMKVIDQNPLVVGQQITDFCQQALEQNPK